MIKEKITFIGAGNMGEALIKGILQAGIVNPEDIIATDINKERLNYIEQKTRVRVLQDNRSAIKEAGIIILSVKPQVMEEVIREIPGCLEQESLIISVAAGITTKYLEEKLGPETKVIRVMPNTPALIGQGVSAISLGRYAGKREEDLARMIFGAVGQVVVVEEELMDTITAISGCGPAYIFLFIETLMEAALGAGLSQEIAHLLSTQTVFGAVKMVIETGEDPINLRQKVTSPGGATEVALRVLNERGWKDSLLAAISAAAARSKELGQEHLKDQSIIGE